MVGTSANDTLTAGAGVDTLVGGTGNATFVVNNTADGIVADANEASNTLLCWVASLQKKVSAGG